MSDSPPQRPARRWFQFSLRTMLIVCIFAGGPLGYLSHRVAQGKRVGAAVKLLRQNGHTVEKFKGNVPIGAGKNTYELEDRDWLWLRGWGPKLLGNETFFRPDQVTIERQGKRIPAREFAAALAELREVNSLIIEGEVTDAWLNEVHLSPNVRHLRLDEAYGGSAAAWEGFFVQSKLANVAFYKCGPRPHILTGLARLETLGSLWFSDCVFDDESLQRLLPLRPQSTVSLRGCLPELFDPKVLRRMEELGIPKLWQMEFTGEEWRTFAERGIR